MEDMRYVIDTGQGHIEQVAGKINSIKRRSRY